MPGRAGANHDFSPRWSRSPRGALLLPMVLLLLSACTASTSGGPHAAGTSSPAHPTSEPTRPYSSTSFVVPFDVDLPSWVTSGTKAEERNFVTWDGSHGTALRVMHPVQVYRPAGGLPVPVPTDFLGWLRSQSRFGVRLTDVQQVKAGPYPATLLTMRGRTDVEGSFGCPRADLAARDCFGAGIDHPLRMALLKVHGKQLVIWLRDVSNAKALTADSASFTAMIKGLRFPDRPVTSATARVGP